MIFNMLIFQEILLISCFMLYRLFVYLFVHNLKYNNWNTRKDVNPKT